MSGTSARKLGSHLSQRESPLWGFLLDYKHNGILNEKLVLNPGESIPQHYVMWDV